MQSLSVCLCANKGNTYFAVRLPLFLMNYAIPLWCTFVMFLGLFQWFLANMLFLGFFSVHNSNSSTQISKYIIQIVQYTFQILHHQNSNLTTQFKLSEQQITTHKQITHDLLQIAVTPPSSSDKSNTYISLLRQCRCRCAHQNSGHHQPPEMVQYRRHDRRRKGSSEYAWCRLCRRRTSVGWDRKSVV